MEEKRLVPKRRFAGFDGEWDRVQLDNIARFSKGRGYSKKDINKSGTPLLLYGSLYTSYETIINKVNTYTTLRENSVISKGNEVVVPSSGETKEDIARASAISKPGIIIGGDLNIIQPNEDINPIFLALDISNGSSQRDLIRQAQGSSVVHLYNEDLKTVQVDYPSIEEQQKIGQFFIVLDERIANQERKIAKVKALKEAYLTEMFPQEGETVPKRRFKGFDGEWFEKRLSEIVSKSVDNRGKTPPLNKNGKYPLIEVVSLGGRKPDYNNVVKYIDKFTYRTFLRDYVQENDILFSTVGRIGLVSLMDTNPYASIAQNIVGFRAKENYCPYFLYALFSHKDSLKRANEIVMGAVQPSIKVSQLINVKYIIPKSYKEQQKIGQFFKNLDDQIATEEAKLEKLKKMKEAYLEEMFV